MTTARGSGSACCGHLTVPCVTAAAYHLGKGGAPC